MLANGIRQTTTGGAADLTLALIAGFPPFSAKYSVGANGDPIPYGIKRDSDGVGVEWGIGHLSTATNFVRDRAIITWDGTTYSDNSPTLLNLSTGGPYTIDVSDNPALRPNSPNGSDPGVGATRYLLGGQWCGNPGASVTLAAGTAQIVPFRLDVPEKSSGISVKVTTAATTGTTKNMRVALYRYDKAGRIGNLVAESAAISVAGTGVKNFLFPAPVRLDPDWYFIAILADGNPGIVATNGQGIAGICPMWGVPGGDPTGRYTVASKAVAYVDTGSCFPSPLGVVSYGADWAVSTPCPTLMAVSA